MASQQPDTTGQALVQGQMERIDKSGVPCDIPLIILPMEGQENNSGEDGFSGEDIEFYGGQ